MSNFVLNGDSRAVQEEEDIQRFISATEEKDEEDIQQFISATEEKGELEDKKEMKPGWAPQPSNPSKYSVVPGEDNPPIPGDQHHYLVSFAPDDPDRPFNWPMWKKIITKGIATLNILICSWGSSAISPGVESDNGIITHFHLGEVAATLVVSLYVLGFAVGPSIWGPMSEMFGRQPPLIIGMFGFNVFCFACATAKDVQTLMICRFFMGAMGSTSLVVGPAISADVFNTSQRGKAILYVILVLTCGPLLAPPINAYIAYDLGWRWTMYITGFIGCALLVLQAFFSHESYPQAVLRSRAVIMRQETGNWAISAPIENIELDTMNIIDRTLLKPLRLLAVEPILILISMYLGLVYSILYMLFVGLPIIFGEHYRWLLFKGNARGNTYLPFLAIMVGAVIMVAFQLMLLGKFQARLLKRTGLPLCPETRLPAMMIGGLSLPIGLFLTCWSAEYLVHWIVPCVGLAFVGVGIIGIFQSGLVYIIDTYLLLAASAISSNTFLRSGMAAGFPLFTSAMFHNEGIHWAGTILGCLTALLAPIPFVFYIFGDRIRGMSRFAASAGIDKKDLDAEVEVDPATRQSRPSSINGDAGSHVSRRISRTSGAV